MKRPVLWLALPVVAMCATGSANRIFVFITFIVCIFLFVFLNKNKRFFIPWISFLLISFFCILANFTLPETIKYINTSGESIETEIVGRVSRFTKKEDYMSIHLKNAEVHTDAEKEKIRGVLVYCDPCEIDLGDKILLHGKLKALETPRMTGCFNEKNYYESINIFSKFNADNLKVISHDVNPITVAANSIKKYLSDAYIKISPDYAGRLSAITLGDQSLLEEDIKESYRKNGIGHILAISGLHVSLTGMFFYRMLRKAGLSFIPCVLCGTIVILIYTVLTGGSISSVRAGVMFCISIIADIPGRSYDPLSSLLLQCMITLLINPYTIRGPSFLMSYISVFSIILFGSQGNKMRIVFNKTGFSKLLFSDMLVSVAVFFALLPINLIFYNEAPVYSVLINMIIIPLSPILMGFGLAGGLIGGVCSQAGIFLVAISEKIFDLYELLCRIFSYSLGKTDITGAPGIFKISIYYSLIILLYCILRFKIVDKLVYAHKKDLLIDSKHKKKIKDKIMMPVILSFLIVLVSFYVIKTAPDKGFYFTMLDVGQGDCIFVHTEKGRNFLFDGGSGNIKNVYSKRVEPFLDSKGIKRLDGIFISHSDADHINAVEDMINKGNIQISNIILPDIKEELKNKAYKSVVSLSTKKGISICYASSGFNITDKDYNLSCLFPQKDESFTDINSLSAVYRFEYKDFSIIFTGDISEESEKKMLDDKKVTQATVLKVAHHGSDYSSHNEFLEAVSPEIALISCGVNNRYGHPGNKTVERLRNNGIPYIVTSESGAITLESAGKGFRVNTYLKTKFED